MNFASYDRARAVDHPQAHVGIHMQSAVFKVSVIAAGLGYGKAEPLFTVSAVADASGDKTEVLIPIL